MDSLTQRRISDIAFTLDGNLNVTDGNRSFLRLLDITDPRINLSQYLDEADCRNLTFFLANFPGRAENPYFIANIRAKAHPVRCLLFVERHGGEFRVDLKELAYSKELLDRALLESREYRALLQNFDSSYFLYEGGEFTLKNTKDMDVAFQGEAGAFRPFFSDNFSLNLAHDDSRTQLDTMLADAARADAGKTYHFLRTDGQLVSVRTHRAGTRDRTAIIGSIAAGRTGMELVNTYNEKKDGLTDLYNKKAITELATKKINEAKNPAALIIMDVDKFKECNDTYGHAFGDKVLVAVANCIKDAIKGKGMAGRIGGDEFMLVLDTTDEADIRNIARNIRIGIQWSITNAEQGSLVTCSMGIARHPLNATDYDSLFTIADKCLYIAKSKGRNCYIIYKPEIHDSVMVAGERDAARVSSGEAYRTGARTEREILALLHGGTADGRQRALTLAAEFFQTDKITVYGADGAVVCAAGADAPDARAGKIGGSYFAPYNEHGFLLLDNTNVLSTIDKHRNELYRTHDIATTLEVRCTDGAGGTRALVCYDKFTPARTFPRDKVMFAILIADLLAETL